MVRLLVAAGVLYAAACLLVYCGADRLIFLPPPPSYRDTPDIIKLTAAGGVEISAVHLLNTGAEYTLLYSHGNAEDLGQIAPLLARLRDWGFAVFAYDYRGYGTSGGRPSERGAYADIDAAFAHLTRTLGVPAGRIIAYGRSVGTGPAIDLARRERLGGLVVESGFMSAFRVMIPFPVLPFDKFRNADKIGQVQCPVLVMHGARDEIIPLGHGERLFAAAREPKRLLVIEEAGHNDFTLVAAERQGRALRDFAALAAGPRTAAR